MSQFPFRPAQNAEAAQFIVDGINDFAIDVNSIIPRGFEGYARLFHPAILVKDGSQSNARWSDVAKHTGQPAHKLMKWWQLSGLESYKSDTIDILRADGAWFEPPEEGCLPRQLATTLWQLLSKYTSTPENCMFAIWEGYSRLAEFVYEAPSFELPARRFHLFEAPIQTIEKTFWSYDGDTLRRKIISDTDGTNATPAEIRKRLSERPAFYQSANLWWPADKSWCVATEIEFDSTVVAGSQQLIDEITSHNEVEAYQLESTDNFWNADSKQNIN